MNKYLTNKSEKLAWWEIPAAVASLVLGMAGVSVIADEFAAGKFSDPINVLAYATVMVVMLLPLFLAARRWLWRSQARGLAASLAKRREDALSLAELDKAVGRRNAAPKVDKLLRKGFLGRMSFTPDGLTLLLDNPAPEAEPAPAPAQEPPADPVLARIRALNDAIDNGPVSDKIDRIEALTASILDTVRQRPDRADDARRFVNYYLPTTLKLLESYSLMEKQSYQGKNIQASRQGIETALDKLIAAIEQQQDRLFRAEALDVEAEIQVLDAMMEGKMGG